MTQPPYFQTGTPIGNGNRTRDQESLFSDPKREDLGQRRRKFADDMAHAAVPADKDDFCDAFFPAPTDPAILKQKPNLTENPFAALAEENLKLLELTVRRLFTKAVNDNNLVPGFKMCECGERPDPASFDIDKQKVDAAFYHNAHAPTTNTQAWPDQVIPVEFKRDENALDPWDDGKDNISTEALERKKGRGQCISYSELLFAIQHRVALFMLVIVGTRARFVRWDRSGTIVTRAFDYVQDWEFFCDVLWRISLCSDAELGLDPTATRLRKGDADFDRMTVAAEKHEDDVDETERELTPDEVPQGSVVYKYVRTMFSESVKSDWPRYRVEVPVGKINKDAKDSKDDKNCTDSEGDKDDSDDKDGKDHKDDKDGQATRHFLIAKPTFRARGMSGRGTRGYVALDCQTGEFVWLKDAWRAHYLLVDKEGDVLRRLNDAKVMNVPTLICHGDIEDQVTVTPDWWEAINPLPSSSNSQSVPPSSSLPSSSTSQARSTASSSASRKRKYDHEGSEDSVPPPKGVGTGLVPFREDCPLRLHRHYRLVEKEVGMPLVKFQSGRQLVSLVLDCIYAHFQASTEPKLKILHRDVSGGNILIIPSILEDENGAEIQWKGILTDWEMSKPKDCQTTPRQPERTGTWQFLSVALLSGNKEVEICDELEAFFYILLYYGVRYLPSNIDDTGVGNWISTFFDTYGVQGDSYVCGDSKLSALTTGTLVVSASKNTSKYVQFDGPFDGVIKDLLAWFKAHRVVKEYESEQARLDSIRHLLRQAAAVVADSSSSTSGTQRRRKPRPTGLGDTELAPGDTSSAPAVGEPSEEDRKVWKHVLTHAKMVGRLELALEDDGAPGTGTRWAKNDMVGDRVGAAYRPPSLAQGPTLSASLASNKRRKVARPQVAASMPALRPHLPPKTPEKKRPAGGALHQTMAYGWKKH